MRKSPTSHDDASVLAKHDALDTVVAAVAHRLPDDDDDDDDDDEVADTHQ